MFHSSPSESVQYSHESGLNSSEFNDVMKNYDHFPVRANDVKINSSEWEVCYVSSLPRAAETAKLLYQGKTISTDLIIEVPLVAFMKTNISVPNIVWHIVGRIAWLFSSKSQIENISVTKQRINDFIDIIEDSGYENILIVSHGFFMKVCAAEIKEET